MASRPKEDPADKAARLRERRATEVERTQIAEKNAAGLTSDLRAVYGMQGFTGSPGGLPLGPTAGGTGIFGTLGSIYDRGKSNKAAAK